MATAKRGEQYIKRSNVILAVSSLHKRALPDTTSKSKGIEDGNHKSVNRLRIRNAKIIDNRLSL